MPRKSQDDVNRKRGKDKKREHFEKNGKYSAKYIRRKAALAEKRSEQKQCKTS